MIGILGIFILLVLAKYTGSIEANCWIVGGFIILFSGAITHQLLEFKKDLNEFACHACIEGSICQRFCKSEKIYAIFAIGLSIIMSLSLISFLILADDFYIAILFMDIFVFHYIFTDFNKSNNQQLVKSATKVWKEIAINIGNVLLLVLMLIALELMHIKNIQINPEIFSIINDKVHHSCIIFQHLLRTLEFFNSSMYATRSIEGIGDSLFVFIYITSISMFPMIAITLLYKFGIKTYYKFRKEK